MKIKDFDDVNMTQNKHKKVVISHIIKNSGRKLEFTSDIVLEVLSAIGRNDKPISPMKIAKYARGKDESKFSNEFKTIRKLYDAGFLKSHLKPTIAGQLSNAEKEVELARTDFEEYAVYCQKQIGYRRKEKEKENDDLGGKYLSEEEKQAYKNKYTKLGIAKKRLSELDKYMGKRGRKDWEYTLSFSGFLLYLINESKAEKRVKTSIDETRKEKRSLRVKKIYEIMRNPLVIEEVPFLRDWWHFDKLGFKALDLLSKIAVEFENLILISKSKSNQENISQYEENIGKYIKEITTKQYFIELENHLFYILDSALSSIEIQDMGIEKYNESLKLRRRDNYQKKEMVPLTRSKILKMGEEEFAKLLKIRDDYRKEVMIPLLNKFIEDNQTFVEFLKRGEEKRKRDLI